MRWIDCIPDRKLSEVSYRFEVERICGYGVLSYSDENLNAALSVKSCFWSCESE